MTHDHCVTLAALAGIGTGFLPAWSWTQRIRPWLRWYTGRLCMCSDERPGWIKLGNKSKWEWSPCPFCRRGVVAEGRRR